MMDSGQRMANYMRMLVDDGKRGTRDDLRVAVTAFDDEIAMLHGDENTESPAMTILFTDHSAMFFIASAAKGDLAIVPIAPGAVTERLTAALLPSNNDGTVDISEALELLRATTVEEDARRRIVGYLHNLLRQEFKCYA